MTILRPFSMIDQYIPGLMKKSSRISYSSLFLYFLLFSRNSSFCEPIRNYIRKGIIFLLCSHNYPIVFVMEQPQRSFVCFQTTIGIMARRRWGHRVTCRMSRARACPIVRGSSFISLRASCHCCYRPSEGDSHVAGTGLPVLVFIGR